ncbi:hypothetical protein LG324_08775 [Phycicoccus jejuensis]|uniref:hypothetical protein n=1 Tax=Phycicoccus jejuensis TaxID=367299 RepID=UPI00384C5625
MTHDIEDDMAEAAALLGWSRYTLRDRCSRRVVPHHRRHSTRGIYFTPEDIAAIRAGRTRDAVRTPPSVPSELLRDLRGLTPTRRRRVG